MRAHFVSRAIATAFWNSTSWLPKCPGWAGRDRKRRRDSAGSILDETLQHDVTRYLASRAPDRLAAIELKTLFRSLAT